MSHECSTFRRLHKNKIDLYCLTLLISNKLRNANLKGSYDVAKKNIILCIWCNAMCLCGLGIKKYYFPHTVHFCCSSMLRLSETRPFLQSSAQSQMVP